MRVVVTGATGHLGGAVVRALLDGGHEVVAASRGGAAVHGADGLAFDLADEACVSVLASSLVADGGQEAVLMHLGAWHPPATAQTGAKERRQLVNVNVLGTMRVLDAARSAGVSAVIYASTFEVYGEPEGAPITERHRTYPLTDYGATKLAGEHHLAAFAYEQGGVRTVALRMPAIYGPGERTPRALPNFLERVASGERPVIHGDGEDLRDQLFVGDAARAFVAALTAGDGVYNLGDGQPHSVGQIARTAMRVAGLSGEPERRERTKPRRDFHMSIERAREELGFEPQVTLEEGMRQQLRWMQAR